MVQVYGRAEIQLTAIVVGLPLCQVPEASAYSDSKRALMLWSGLPNVFINKKTQNQQFKGP